MFNFYSQLLLCQYFIFILILIIIIITIIIIIIIIDTTVIVVVVVVDVNVKDLLLENYCFRLFIINILLDICY